MSIGKYAAMVPVAMASRTENLIYFFSDDWEDLPCLLEAPLEFIRAQQFLWQQDPATSIPWQLITPINATIACALQDLQTLQRFLSPIAPQVYQYVYGMPEPMMDPQDPVSGLDLTNVSTLQLIQSKLAGCFAVEFNTYTTNIRIYYIPPVTVNGTTVTPINTGRYQGHFDGLAVISIGAAGFGLATLHADLVETGARMKADFIVGVLEDPDGYVDVLNKANAGGQLKVGKYEAKQATEKKGRITLPDVPSTTIPQINFTAGLPRASAAVVAPDLGNATDWMSMFDKFFEIEVTNLSEAAVTNGCSLCDLHLEAGGTKLFLNKMLVENYLRVLNDPCFMVRHCLGKAREEKSIVAGSMGPVNIPSAAQPGK